jgi:lysophospholipase L1-like esterase
MLLVMKMGSHLSRSFRAALFAVCFYSAQAQDPLRLRDEVDALVSSDAWINNHDVVLFTGSSSIRMWTDLKATYPNRNVLNRGFGGSEMSDLVYYFDVLIKPYRSKQIFIYEGDNDLQSGKSSAQILVSADSLLRLIRKNVDGNVQVFFMTPKPSPSRWHLKEKYIKYNEELRRWVSRQKHVTCVDVWNPLLDDRGVVRKDIFLEDGLHLNRKGYVLWAKAIGKYIR